jgi:hypothetical protein
MRPRTRHTCGASSWRTRSRASAPSRSRRWSEGWRRNGTSPGTKTRTPALEAELAGAFVDEEELLAARIPFYFARYDERERAWIDELRADRLKFANTLRLLNEEILKPSTLAFSWNGV